MSECPTPVHLFNADERRYLRLDCKRRRCAHCGPARWKPYVQARVFRGVQHAHASGRAIRVFTLTAPGHVEDLARWNLYANDRFAAFLDELRRRFPRLVIDYWKVREFQKRGLIHFHGLMVGLPFVDLGWLKALAVRHGFGSRLEFHAPHGGVKALVGYYTKYVLKSAGGQSHDYEPLHAHVVTHSHDFAPEWKPRRSGTGGTSWTWISEVQWWAGHGRAAFLAAVGAEDCEHTGLVVGGGLHPPEPPTVL